jgi:hypothetical protein
MLAVPEPAQLAAVLPVEQPPKLVVPEPAKLAAVLPVEQLTIVVAPQAARTVLAPAEEQELAVPEPAQLAAVLPVEQPSKLVAPEVALAVVVPVVQARNRFAQMNHRQTAVQRIPLAQQLRTSVSRTSEFSIRRTSPQLVDWQTVRRLRAQVQVAVVVPAAQSLPILPVAVQQQVYSALQPALASPSHRSWEGQTPLRL